MKPTSLTLCAVIACASSLLYLGPAGAQDAVPSQLDQLSGFVGDGTCTGHFLGKPSHATTGKFRGEKALGGHWISIRCAPAGRYIPRS